MLIKNVFTMRQRKFLAVLAFLAGVAPQAMAGNKADTLHLRLVETTDVHGNFYGYDFLSHRNMPNGLARVSTYVNNLRQTAGTDNVALFDNGDVLQGQPCVYYANFVDTLSLHLSARMMRYMGYDAGALGNHDIEAGHHVYDRWMAQGGHPVLGANVIASATGQPYVAPYTVIHRGGLKIAVLGLLTPAIPMWLPQDLWSGLQFADIVATARQWAAYIKENEKPDLLVGLFHTGLKGGSMNGYNENAAEEIATTVPGFDIIFYGHDHQPYCLEVDNTQTGHRVWLLNAGVSAARVAVADVAVTGKGSQRKAAAISGSLVSMADVAPDEAFLQTFRPDYDKVEAYVDKKIGTLAQPINTFDYFFGASSVADLIHAVQLEQTHADISLVTPLTYNEVLPAGDMHVSDIFRLYRYENRIDIFCLKGSEVRGALERSYGMWANTMTSADDHALAIDDQAPSFDGQPGRGPRLRGATFLFLSAAGIRYTVDLTNPVGQKVTIEAMADGTPFDADKTYRVAVNSYTGSGGGGLLTEGAGIAMADLPERIVWTSEKDLRYYIIDYFASHNAPIEVKPVGQWRFVPADWADKALLRDRALLNAPKAASDGRAPKKSNR